MSRDPALAAAVAARSPWIFVALRIELPGHVIRLLDGAGAIQIADETYTGRDEVFGTLAAMEALVEDESGQAPELRFVLHPADMAAAVALTSPSVQGALMWMLVGAFNPATGLPIGQPDIPFYGEIDVPVLQLGEHSRQIEFTAVSVFERLFEIDEGQRATDGFHQSIWPGELGLYNMTGTEQKLYWGTKPPSGPTGGIENALQAWEIAPRLGGR